MHSTQEKTDFRAEIHIPGLSPLLLLSLVEFDRCCIFADALRSFAPPTHTMAFDGQLIQMVRNGTIQTIQEFEFVLCNDVPVSYLSFDLAEAIP